MPEVVADTSVVQYLHQLGQLGLLQRLYGRVVVPGGVARELAAGRARGVDLPDLGAASWVEVREVAAGGLAPLVGRLGSGELEVLALAVERREQTLVLLDDAVARRHAGALGLRLSGTLGVLIRACRQGLIEDLARELDRLHQLGFRLDRQTRDSALRLAERP